MFKVKKLNFTYPKNKQRTIKDITFTIKEGEIFGFLGPSGAGKSTTQKILIKLLQDYNGNISFLNHDLKSLDYNYYEDIGVGFEMPVHFSKLTALENLHFFQGLYNKRIDLEPILKSLALWEHRNKLVSKYSKGMKVRLNFIRAILNQPKVLFLDEPTNGLDPVNAKIIKDHIKQFNHNGGTVFITSHNMRDIEELCDRVAFIVDGEIKEIDSPKNLKYKYGTHTVKVEYLNQELLISKEFPLHNLGENEEFIKILKNNKIKTIHSGESTLEDIFIKITGVSLDHDEEVL